MTTNVEAPFLNSSQDIPDPHYSRFHELTMSERTPARLNETRPGNCNTIKFLVKHSNDGKEGVHAYDVTPQDVRRISLCLREVHRRPSGLVGVLVDVQHPVTSGVSATC
eukprot:GHVU01182981.1.p1 GENE.GHVU01182981.1~~GHVU01182981.1.p1  ORF type:complete len:109 (-),score=5.41 GHVU01182981.1:457-783(-)